MKFSNKYIQDQCREANGAQLKLIIWDSAQIDTISPAMMLVRHNSAGSQTGQSNPGNTYFLPQHNEPHEIASNAF